MRIVSVQSDSFSEFNSGNWAAQIAARTLNRHGHRVTLPYINRWLYNWDNLRVELNQADLIIIQRVMVEEGVDRVRHWRGKGKPVACSIDDSYSLLQPESESGNQAAKFWQRGEVEISHPEAGVSYMKKLERHPLEQFIEGCKMISGLIMPSRILAHDWQWATRTYYLPNYIDSERYLTLKATQKPDPDWITIGWGGSLSHKLSFEKSGVLEALRRVCIKRRNVRVLIAGDKRIFDTIPVAPNQKVYQNYVHWTDWPRVMGRFDIGIAPLFGRYDWSRSGIKLEEASIMGIPIIATGCPTYQDWMDADVGLYVMDGEEAEQPKRADEWETALLDVVDNYPEHKRKIEGQFDIAMQYDAERNYENILAVYQAVAEGKPSPIP